MSSSPKPGEGPDHGGPRWLGSGSVPGLLVGAGGCRSLCRVPRGDRRLFGDRLLAIDVEHCRQGRRHRCRRHRYRPGNAGLASDSRREETFFGAAPMAPVEGGRTLMTGVSWCGGAHRCPAPRCAETWCVRAVTLRRPKPSGESEGRAITPTALLCADSTRPVPAHPGRDRCPGEEHQHDTGDHGPHE